MERRVRVVCGAILRDGRVLAARRGPSMRNAGAWELPGGKVEPGEDDAAALARELHEELGVRVRVGAPLGTSVLGRIELVGFACTTDDAPQASEHDALRWLDAETLSEVAWAEADVPLLAPLSALLRAPVLDAATLEARAAAVAKARGLLAADATAPLGRAVRALSDAYNRAAFPVRTDAALDAARLHFFLPRDAAKVTAALRDVALPDTGGAPLRLLDVGAGIGASALGVRAAMDARHDVRGIQARLVDSDARALRLAGELLGTAGGLAALPGLEVKTAVVDLARAPPAVPEARFDLILFCQVLVEVAHGRAEDERVATHAGVLRRFAAQHLAPGGLLVVIEPALRVAARRLQRVRAAIVAAPGPLHLVAPCPHDGPCPLLARDEDWCHEDLPIDLPASLAPVARAAGLRWQGLTFARLVLSDRPQARPPLRVAAPVRSQKGRHVLTLCAEGGLRDMDRLDRDRTPSNADWDGLSRGDGLTNDAEGARVGPDTSVRRFTP